ncbi:NUDIX hydrolase [Endothiovibrio diazotrophicus]
MSIGKWRQLERRSVHRDRWIDLSANRFEYDGRIIEPYYLFHYPDWVVTIAVTREREVVLVRQYRPGSDEVTIEFPTGVIDVEDDGPLAAGMRELREESGFGGGEGVLLEPMTVHPSHFRNRYHVVVVEGVERLGEQALDETEWLEVERVSVAELERMIDRGEFSMGPQVGAYFRARLRFPALFGGG